MNSEINERYEFFTNENFPNAICPPTFSRKKGLANLSYPNLTLPWEDVFGKTSFYQFREKLVSPNKYKD